MNQVDPKVECVGQAGSLSYICRCIHRVNIIFLPRQTKLCVGCPLLCYNEIKIQYNLCLFMGKTLKIAR